MLGLCVYFMGGFTTLFRSKHLLTVFIGLEIMVLGVVLVAVVILNSSIVFFLLIICMSVCEASISLSLLVIIARVCGNDRCSSLISDNC